MQKLLLAGVCIIGLAACTPTQAIISHRISEEPPSCEENDRLIGQYALPESRVGFDLTKGPEDDDPWTFNLVHETVPDNDHRYILCFNPHSAAYDNLHIQIENGLLGSAALESDARLNETAADFGALLDDLRKDFGVTDGDRGTISYVLSRTSARASLEDYKSGPVVSLIGRRVFTPTPSEDGEVPAEQGDQPAPPPPPSYNEGFVYAVVRMDRDGAVTATAAIEAVAEDADSSKANAGNKVDENPTGSQNRNNTSDGPATGSLFFRGTRAVAFSVSAIACPENAALADITNLVRGGVPLSDTDGTSRVLSGCVNVAPEALPVALLSRVFAVADTDEDAIFSLDMSRGFGSDDRTSATFAGGLLQRVEIDNQGGVIDAIRIVPTALGLGRDDEDASGADGENTENDSEADGSDS